MFDAAPGIERALTATGLVTTRIQTAFGSGFTNPEVFDWQASLADHVRQFRPEVTVALFGGYDWIPWIRDGAELRPGTPDWEAAYRAEVDRAVATLTSDGGTVYWLGLPRVAIPEADAAMVHLNQVFRELPARHAGVDFVDLGLVLAGPDGGYAAALPGTDGGPVPVRKDDGVHFLPAGADLIGSAVTAEVVADWHLGAF
jgi:hypothetical protein